MRGQRAWADTRPILSASTLVAMLFWATVSCAQTLHVSSETASQLIATRYETSAYQDASTDYIRASRTYVDAILSGDAGRVASARSQLRANIELQKEAILGLRASVAPAEVAKLDELTATLDELHASLPVSNDLSEMKLFWSLTSSVLLKENAVDAVVGLQRPSFVVKN